jgi:hypothetical protein
VYTYWGKEQNQHFQICNLCAFCIIHHLHALLVVDTQIWIEIGGAGDVDSNCSNVQFCTRKSRPFNNPQEHASLLLLNMWLKIIDVH